MTYANKQRLSAWRTDHEQRKREREQLDGYGWVMSLDAVRTPEEILLVKERFARLERHIDKLQPRIARVLRLRLGINCEPLTFDAIAQQFDVTRERIRQMENKGLRIIKRRIWIEEKPEDYRRQCENERKVYKRRIELEKAAEVDRIQARLLDAEMADWSEPTPVRVSQPQYDYARDEAREIAREEVHKRLLQRRAQYAQDAYDFAYREAHAVNAGWQDELARREQEARQARRNAVRRMEFERRVKTLIAKRDAMLSHPTADPERDWLFVASKEFT